VCEVIPRFPDGARVLDLGCGQGQDSAHLAANGFHVTAMDFVRKALHQIPDQPGTPPISRFDHSIVDFPYPFRTASFDVAYSHLAVHYFSRRDTFRIFKELRRVTRPGGLLCVMVNSVDDPECGTGRKLGRDWYKIASGDCKRFFTRASLYNVTRAWFIPYLLEQTGRTRKDNQTTFVRLIAERVA
jgi:SAM-dependent methyltransferase